MLFFLLSLLFGWLAWNVYHPILHNPRLCAVSFLAGWLTGELALHHVAVQALIVFGFVWAGAVDGFFGALGLMICVASWLALVLFHDNGARARSSVEDALALGLGDDYRDQIKPEIAARFPEGPDDRRIRFPFMSIDNRVEVIKNVGFGNHGQRLDIYRPRKPVSNAPVLFQIHGGAWTEKLGSKDGQAIPLMSHMAQRDWICVSTDYRLCPTATFPDHMIDCKEALRWIKENIEEHGGDPSFVVVTGGSAGGHLSALLALTANDPAYQPGFEDLDTSVQGAVPFYGVYDLLDSNQNVPHQGQKELYETSLLKIPRDEAHQDDYKAASPYWQASDTAPPFFVIQGDSDSLVPVGEARSFVKKLKEVSINPVAYAEIEGAQHAFDMFPSPRSEHTKQGVERFLAWLYSQRDAG